METIDTVFSAEKTLFFTLKNIPSRACFHNAPPHHLHLIKPYPDERKRGSLEGAMVSHTQPIRDLCHQSLRACRHGNGKDTGSAKTDHNDIESTDGRAMQKRILQIVK